MRVYQQVCIYLEQGFPYDAQRFIKTLAQYYKTPWPLLAEHFGYAAV